MWGDQICGKPEYVSPFPVNILDSETDSGGSNLAGMNKAKIMSRSQQRDSHTLQGAQKYQPPKHYFMHGGQCVYTVGIRGLGGY